MKTYFHSSSIIFAIVALGAWLSRTLGWYNDYWYADVILHTLSGIAFGILWMAIIQKNLPSSWFVFCIGVVSFAAFGSILWEFWEFAGWRLSPSHTQFYLGTLDDTLGDILCGTVGGLLSAVGFLVTQPSVKKEITA